MNHAAARPRACRLGWQRVWSLGSAVAIAGLLAACSDKADSGAAGAGAPPQRPAPEVSVVTVEKTTVALTTELPGRLEASRVAQVRARASGIVQKRLFREGSEVKAGQPLFEIDASPYAAALDSALAQQARAEAAVAQTSAQVERFKPLVEANAISRQEYANAVAAQKQAEADRAVARAAIKTARINLGFTRVTAPIAGRIGRSLVTEGALVGQGEATQLALIQQIDPLYVNFTQSTSELLQLRKALASGKLQQVGGGDTAVPVRIKLDDGSEYPHAGRLLFTDLTVDATTGQVTLRAELPNPQRLLLPGMYVRVRLQQAEMVGGILLPQQAVTRGGTGDTVLVVGDDNKPTQRQIKIASAQGNQWLVTDGLQAGERVVVAGFQKMMVPGAPVKPVPWQPAAGASAALAAVPASAASPAASGAVAAGGPASAARAN
ncbi:efflux RND transporter periplasmic adaptor subunit [Piscinibacter sakaiensis]|uniref:efflux RND transporter periplasmic adaptor subunit n=1 Tax=Piscinibacter sakaiensis TaxID=1547922 RepID=UPI003AB007C9